MQGEANEMDETTKIVIAVITALFSGSIFIGVVKFIIIGFFKRQAEDIKENTTDIQAIKEDIARIETRLKINDTTKEP